MIRLNSPDQRLKIVLTAAKTTTDMPIEVGYIDYVGNVATHGSQRSNTNGVTAVYICAGPAATSINRVIDSINVYQADTAAKTVQMQVIDGVTAYPLIDVVLQVDDVLRLDANGWTVTDANGGKRAAGALNYGTTTNNSAAAGVIGEFITSTVASGSAVALTANTQANITSISLTAGDWDVSGMADFSPNTTTSITLLSAGLGITTATQLTQAGGSGVGTDPLAKWAMAAGVPGANVLNLQLPPVRVSLSATTTIYFVALATFTVSTLSVFGTIRARRIR